MHENSKASVVPTFLARLNLNQWALQLRWVGLVAVLAGVFVMGRMKAHVAPQPVDTYQDLRWIEMVNALSDSARQYNGDVGIYIKNLKTGQVYEYNSDRAFVCASLIKFPIMLATFEAIWEGSLSLNTRLLYRRQDRRGGSGRLKWANSGAYYPVSQLIYSMITKSDNTATAMLIDRLGYDYLNTSFQRMGLVTTRINPEGMSLASYLPPAKDNYTTPREMGMLLERLYRHQVVNDGLSDLMLEIMKGANGHSRLAQHLPSQWKLARKTGLLRKNCHDVGIVFTPNADYVMCVLTGHNNNYRRAKGFIASVGRKAYSYMGNS